jgi:Spy/CpxP family protein refolding chaperone
MKRFLPALAVIVVLATGVSFALARLTMAHRPTAANLSDTGWLKRELNLTDEQTTGIAQLEAEFRTQLQKACTDHCAARMTLGEELVKPDTAKCRAAVEKMNAVQAESERATLEHILKVRSLLNEQQAQRYSALVRDQVCNMPMGAP